MQALVVYTTAAYLLINLAVDLLYGLIDPRIRVRENRMSAAAALPLRARKSRSLRFVRRFVSHPGALAGGVVLATILAIAAIAPWVVPYDWNETNLDLASARRAQNSGSGQIFTAGMFSPVFCMALATRSRSAWRPYCSRFWLAA